jgi:hypothetical protein
MPFVTFVQLNNKKKKNRTQSLLNKHVEQTVAECRSTDIETLYKYNRQQKQPFEALANGMRVWWWQFYMQISLIHSKFRTFMDGS